MSNIITPIIVVPDVIYSYHGLTALKTRLIKKCMRKNKMPIDHDLTDTFSYFSVPETKNGARPADEAPQRAPRARFDNDLDELQNDFIQAQEQRDALEGAIDNFTNDGINMQIEAARAIAAMFNKDLNIITKINMLVGENQANDTDINEFWQTVNQLNEKAITVKNILSKTNTEKIKIMTVLKELYHTMHKRLNTVLDTLAVSEKNKETYIFSFIGRGYMVYEAILETPDLAMFFIQNENNTMPAFVTEIIKIFNIVPGRFNN